MDENAKTVAVEEIRTLRAKFARSMDTKNWSALRDCIDENCHFDCTQEAGITEPWIGSEAIVGNIRRSFATATTVHHAHTAEIEILSPTTAKGVWAMQDLLRFPGFPTIELVGFGHYHEEYAKNADGRWRLAKYRLTRLRVDVARVFPAGREPVPAKPRPTANGRTINAIRLHDYGPPESLVVESVPEPIPQDGEVLIKVAGAAVNPVDLKARDGSFGLFMPLTFPAQLGGDVSGTVEAVGPGVTTLAVGDRVMGMINPFADGAYADKVVVPATLLARVPAKLDLAEAAALPMGALTGSQLIEVGLKSAKGDVVLVTGAAGSVGRAAVYAAAKAGAKVVAGVRKGSEAVVKDLPVAAVIDLADLAAAKAAGPFDGIADTVGGLVVERLARFLKRGGTIASAVSPTPVPDAEHGVTVKSVWVAFDGPRLTAFAEEVAAGRYMVPIATKLPLIEAAEAKRVAERGASRGKVLLVPKV